MKKFFKIFGIVLVLALVGIQFVPGEKNVQAAIPEEDIRHTYEVPEHVLSILERACYDCHSNNTKYPWYSKVQPARMIMDGHVEEGKEHLNFNEFGLYPEKIRLHKLEELVEEVEEGEMPLPSYVRMHDEAVLTKEDVEALEEWVESIQ